MSVVLSPVAFARQPLQQRAKDRFESVLDTAEAILLEVGLDGFSIPELAKRLGYTRASIYKFFPTPATILNELAKRGLTRMEQMLYGIAPELLGLNWRDGASAVAWHVTTFFNAHPIFRLLTLGGHLDDDGYRAQQLTIQRLGLFLRQLVQQAGVNLPRESPDVATLTVEIGTACFRQSFYQHGEITPAYGEEAGKAMVAYLSHYMLDVAAVAD